MFKFLVTSIWVVMQAETLWALMQVNHGTQETKINKRYCKPRESHYKGSWRFDARNTPRYRRVQGIADRYYANIQNTPTWRNAFNTARENALAGTPAALRSGGRLAEANTIGYGAADNIRFPQSVYMGLNNG